MRVITMAVFDKRAVEGMPLKLAFVTILLSLAVPTVLASLSSFQQQSASLRYQDEAARVKRLAEQVYMAGPGNARTIQLHLPAGNGMMVLGGNTSWKQSRISYMAPGAIPTDIYLGDPLVRFKTANSEGQVLSGDCQLTLRCVALTEGLFVEVIV